MTETDNQEDVETEREEKDNQDLNPCQDLIGLWKGLIPVYGGLMLIKATSNGIEGWELIPPRCKELRKPLRMKALFRLDFIPDARETLSVSCLGHPNEFGTEHRATLRLVENVTLEFECSSPEVHYDNDRKYADLKKWLTFEKGAELEEEDEFPTDESSMHKKFFRMRKHNFQYSFERLDTSAWDRDLGFGDLPVAPGLFKNTFYIDENAIVDFNYYLDDDNRPYAMGTKLTGDRFDSFGAMAFKAFLDYPINMTSSVEEQKAIADLDEAVEMNREDYSGVLDPDAEQPFAIPEEYSVEHDLEVPQICKYRYHGEMFPREECYEYAKYGKGHWVIFDNDTFGFLYFEEQRIKMFHRIQDLCPDPTEEDATQRLITAEESDETGEDRVLDLPEVPADD